jgi:hypothetical protein
MTLDEGVARLLEQCDREDANTSERRFLYTSEIRMLLGVGPGPDWSGLKSQVDNAISAA